MLTIIQQDLLITFVTSHKFDCNCNDCLYFGGIKNIFDIYEIDLFTDHFKRKVWTWLKLQFNMYGTCYITDLNTTEDVTAPKLSEILQSHIDSYQEDFKNYQNLKQIMLNDCVQK